MFAGSLAGNRCGMGMSAMTVEGAKVHREHLSCGYKHDVLTYIQK